MSIKRVWNSWDYCYPDNFFGRKIGPYYQNIAYISHNYTIYSCGLFVVLWYYDNAVLWYQKNPVLVLTWEIRSSTMVTDVEKQKDYNSVDLPHNSNYVVGG